MKSFVFVKAAELIDAGEGTSFACNAIQNVSWENGLILFYQDAEEKRFFQDVFDCHESTFTSKLHREWRSENPRLSVTPDDVREKLFNEAREVRVLALLLAAELVKSEKKSYHKSKYRIK